MQSTDSSYNVPPFPAFPSTSRYVPLGSVQEALGRVCRSIDAHDAISLVIGPPGTGKSLICGLLVEHYRDSHEVVILGETPIESQAAFLRHLLHHLGADFNSIPDGDLQLALKKHVCSDEAAEGGLLLVVDEAQSLSPDVMESIRMVTNLMRDGEPRIVAVLCGGVKLDEILVEPAMEAFTQRVATRCYLHAMNGEETRRYVTETIRSCGADPDQAITAEAIAAVHHACSGVPRLINQMLTQAIDCAEEADQALITNHVVERAWAQLQQLPSPMVEEPKIIGSGAAVEFGELDEPAVETGTDTSHQHQGVQWDRETPDTPVEALPSAGCQSRPCESEHCQEEVCIEEQWEPVQAEPVQAEPAQPTVQQPCAEEDLCGSVPELHGDAESNDVSVAEVTTGHATSAAPADSPSLAALFGDYEEEEQLAIGDGIFPAVRPTSSQPPADLESMLHQEIVGMNPYSDMGESFADAATLSAPQPVTNGEGDAGEFDDQPQERVEDFVTVSDDEADREPESHGNPVLWMPDCDEGDDGIRIADDSDLLVIEDEVDLEPVETAARRDARDQTISVDFQAMLNRMRSGS